MAAEAGYTQQKIQPWQRLDATRSGVKGGGRGGHMCAPTGSRPEPTATQGAAAATRPSRVAPRWSG